jgi:predicted dehydrogenase
MTDRKIRWGVLGVARIAMEKVIPAMQLGEHCTIAAIASRDQARADAAAKRLGIPKAYGSYDALLKDPDIDAIYNPLPNHLHLPWSMRAAEAGKHVLCEKPIGLTTDEARQLIAVRDRTGVKMQEGFMVRTHPQWLKALEICRSGELGKIQSFMGHFSFYNDRPENIRNVPEFGGGALMDVGCYLVLASRLVFGDEPRRVMSLIARDPGMHVDVVTSMLLDFPSGQAVGTCGTRIVSYQRVHVFGTKRHLEIEIPFNAPRDRPCRMWIDDGRNPDPGEGVSVETVDEIAFETCNQYTVQGEAFSRAILENRDVPYPLEMSARNMAVIDALVRSAQSGRWETP